MTPRDQAATNVDRASGPERYSVAEATVAATRRALDDGVVTSVELVAACLERIARYDRHGIHLNAVPVLNPQMVEEARASDERRRTGRTLGPLDGIPYTAKDSYAVEGLTVASGSPAFADLIASRDAFAIERMRAAGAVLIGLTNMPPMADGGMQRGLYGRAESPYNADFLPAAFGSGSSNGSGAGTAASLAIIGLGEETWSSGRSPASNNGLVAYTPSRGVISVRGNWPLYPTMDVVVPHTRSVPDLLELLDVLVADDPEPRGDFWRTQPWVALPPLADVRPASYAALADDGALAGARIGVPRMYINADEEIAEPIVTRESIMDRWRSARTLLESLGATVVETDFPPVTNYEGDRPGARTIETRGLVPAGFSAMEWELGSIYAWDEYLRSNGDPALNRFRDVDGALLFPENPGEIPNPENLAEELERLVEVAKQRDIGLDDLPGMAEAVRGLEETRRIDLEQWMDEQGLDAIVFPANADVAPADADVDPASSEIAWRNGVAFSNGNSIPRHLGIPTVTVTMGLLDDIGMPVGLTFAGRAYDDARLLALAGAFEAAADARVAPPRTPERALDVFPRAAVVPPAARPAAAPVVVLDAAVEPGADGTVVVRARIEVESTSPLADLVVTVDGEQVPVNPEGDEHDHRTVVDVAVPRGPEVHAYLHSRWREPYGSIVVVRVRDETGGVEAAYSVVGGIA
ncbi:amidase [Labedella phragmitis]|uniref:Amidase n=1 Tax=Labedella phragmitis TaxID=2498849 RepID=A0A444PSY7_9MICO|nr:amidase [Labedella phragmitis]